MPSFPSRLLRWPPRQPENDLAKSRLLDTPVETPLAAAPPSSVRLFLMTNSFETGGSERQFGVLARNLRPEQFQVHLGCIQRIGPFADDFGEVPEFRLGGSLYGWASWRTRLRLSRCLRQQHIQIAHAFDFYTNLTLIPA